MTSMSTLPIESFNVAEKHVLHYRSGWVGRRVIIFCWGYILIPHTSALAIFLKHGQDYLDTDLGISVYGPGLYNRCLDVIEKPLSDTRGQNVYMLAIYALSLVTNNYMAVRGNRFLMFARLNLLPGVIFSLS